MTYRKGYVGELELVHMLFEKGYAVVRTPRSGRINLPSPDIVAAKDGKLIVIECKSRHGGFTVSKEQLDELVEWETRAKAYAYVAWKVAYKGWFFLRLADVIANNGNVGKKFLSEKSISIDQI